MYKLGERFVIEIGESYRTGEFKSNGEACTPNHLYKVKGFNSLIFTERELSKLEKYDENTDYEKGLSNAWEVAKKICLNPDDGGIDSETIEKIFGAKPYEVMKRRTPQEAIDKLKAWEEKQEIEVGDVVKTELDEFVVIHAGKDDLRGFAGNGVLYMRNKNDVTKTGKHIDLTEIFKGLEGEDV